MCAAQPGAAAPAPRSAAKLAAALAELSTFLSATGEHTDRFLHELLRLAARLAGAQRVALWLRDGDRLHRHRVYPDVAPAARATLRLGEGAEGLAAAQGEAVQGAVDRAAAAEESAVAVPITLEGEVRGVLAVARGSRGPAGVLAYGRARGRPQGARAGFDGGTIHSLEVLGRYGVAAALREAARRSEGWGARRTELLLNLAMLPDLALEAGPDARPEPPRAPAALGPAQDRAARAPRPFPLASLPARTSDRAPDRWTTTPEGLHVLRPSLQRVAGMIRAALGVAAAGFMLFDPARQHLVPAGSAGTPEEASAAAAAALAPVFAGGEPRRVDAPAADGAARGFLEHLAAGALMAVPVAVEAEPCGVLYVAAERPGAFGEQDLAFLTLVAGRVGLLLERAELTRLEREIDRQRAQAAARQEFLGIVTHELKTPVAVLRAYTEVLLARAEQAGRAGEVELLQRMDDQAERLLGMVEQVLDLQRLDAGLFPLEVGRVDLAAVAARVLEGLRLTAANVQLRLDAEAGVDVRADRRRIEQVLINLVQNAIRFSPPGGEVVVRIGHAGPTGGEGAGALGTAERDAGPPRAPGARWVHVSVSDQGPGVSEEDRARIFARFYQGKGGDRLHRGHGGLGVGLYIAREIVARHGGDLWLEPAAAGVTGATFTFVLPVAGPDEDE